MTRLQGNHQEELDTLKRQHTLESEQTSNEVEQLKREHMAQLEIATNERNTLFNELDETKEALRSQSTEHNLVLEQTRNVHESELQDLEERLSAKASVAKEAHNAELNKLKQEQLDEVNKIKKELNDTLRAASEQDAMYAATTKNLSTELAALKGTHDDTTEKLRKSRDACSAAETAVGERDGRICDLELSLSAFENREATSIAQTKNTTARLASVLEDGEKREKELFDLRNENSALCRKLEVTN
jgi:chromosome segregation ATPase